MDLQKELSDWQEIHKIGLSEASLVHLTKIIERYKTAPMIYSMGAEELTLRIMYATYEFRCSQVEYTPLNYLDWVNAESNVDPDMKHAISTIITAARTLK